MVSLFWTFSLIKNTIQIACGQCSLQVGGSSRGTRYGGGWRGRTNPGCMGAGAIAASRGSCEGPWPPTPGPWALRALLLLCPLWGLLTPLWPGRGGVVGRCRWSWAPDCWSSVNSHRSDRTTSAGIRREEICFWRPCCLSCALAVIHCVRSGQV